MIKSFRHKGLEKFYRNNDKSRIQQDHAVRLARILDRLDASMRPQDMNLPGYKLHKLSGREKRTWAVWVSGNWRVIFRFDGADALDIDYRDYH